MAGKVDGHDTVRFRENRDLGSPVARIATPAMYKDESRLSGAEDLVRNHGPVFGWNQRRLFGAGSVGSPCPLLGSRKIGEKSVVQGPRSPPGGVRAIIAAGQ